MNSPKNEDNILKIFKELNGITNQFKEMNERIVNLENEITILKGVRNPPHRPPKDIEVSEIIKLAESGISARSIATRLGVTPNTITNRLENAGYICIRGKWKASEPSASEVSMILELLDSGNSISSIATELEVSPNTITNTLEKVGYIFVSGKWKASSPMVHLNRIKEIINGKQDGKGYYGDSEELERLSRKIYQLSSKASEYITELHKKWNSKRTDPLNETALEKEIEESKKERLRITTSLFKMEIVEHHGFRRNVIAFIGDDGLDLVDYLKDGTYCKLDYENFQNT